MIILEFFLKFENILVYLKIEAFLAYFVKFGILLTFFPIKN